MHDARDRSAIPQVATGGAGPKVRRVNRKTTTLGSLMLKVGKAYL